ncbi:MAG: PilZ domain-containing protein [Candidatus Omnitrophica bacterium]|nr:PilZ domain-containing protein [Candidatus Omnitrophota bacterium]
MTSPDSNQGKREQRKHRRISGSVIEYSYVQADPVRAVAFMKDLSLGGVCIYLHEEVSFKTLLWLWIHHFGHDQPIEAIGEVIWQKPSHFIHGFETGIKFTDLKLKEKDKLEDFIETFTTETEENDANQTEAVSVDGVHRQFYTTGELLSEVNVIQGKMEGVRRYYYRTGEVLEELNWFRGQRHGPRKCYYSDGKVYLEQEFKEGACVSTQKFDKQGKLIR